MCRRHPLAPDGTPSRGIEEEMALLEPLRDLSSRLIDTTEMSIEEVIQKVMHHVAERLQI